jgi:hypothetical protein
VRAPALALLVITAALAAACADAAEDCHNLGTCPLPPTPIVEAPSNTCQGTCVPAESMEPWLVWFGGGQAPGDLCEQVQPTAEAAFDGTVQPPPMVCPACTCSTPSGSCDVDTVTESIASCMASMPGFTFPFAPPTAWDGSCLGVTSAAGVAASVTLAPVVVHDACTPQMIMDTKPPHPPQTWSYAHACAGFAMGACKNDGEICVPALPSFNAPAGLWTYCVSSPTETLAPCPSNYPIGRTFGNGWTKQTCTDCTCTAVGGSCTTSADSLVTFYSDDACSNEIGAVVPETSMSMCVDVPGSPGSMSATLPTYMPGTCVKDGGEVIGGPPTPAEPMAFCCQE